MGKEPKCTNNHEAQMRMLRDNNLPARDCPNCGWNIRPARKEPEPELFTQEQEDRIRELIREKLIEFGVIRRAAEDE